MYVRNGSSASKKVKCLKDILLIFPCISDLDFMTKINEFNEGESVNPLLFDIKLVLGKSGLPYENMNLTMG